MDVLVVVDVQLGVGVGGARSFEGEADKVLAEDVVEDRGPERAVLVEDLVNDILRNTVSAKCSSS